MTLHAFQAAAHVAIDARTVDAGDNYIVDHRDGTLYLFSVWANAQSIAFDQVFNRGDAAYRPEYREACSIERAGRTIHVARA